MNSPDDPNAITPRIKEDVVDADFLVENGIDVELPFSTPFSHPDAKEVSNRGAYRGYQNTGLYEVLPNSDGGPTLTQLTTMRRTDGQARALYRLLTLPIRSSLSSSSLLPADGGEKEMQLVKDALYTPARGGGMETTFTKFTSHLLMALFDGFAAFEKVLWVPTYGPLKGKMTYLKLAHRPSDTVTFIADAHGNFSGLRQRAWMGGTSLDTFIPASRAFYYASQEEERKFYGLSYFQSAFYHYDKKQKLYYTSNLAAQRTAIGTRVGKYPKGITTAAKREFGRNLSNMALSAWMAIPDDFVVDILKEGGNFDFMSQINHHNSQMSKSILAAFFDKDQGKGAGEGSLVTFAQPGDDMFILMLRAIMAELAMIINTEVIPQLVDMNFDSGKYPTFVWGSLTDAQQAAVSKTFDKLASAGPSLNVTPEFMRQLEENQADAMGLKINYEEVEAREAEEAAKAAELAAAPPVDPNATGAAPGAPMAAPAPFDDQQAKEFEAQISEMVGSK